jgi:mono/diheme cytochrome c family protein
MRKVLKWIGIVLGVILGLLLLAVVGVILYSQMSFKRSYANRPLYPIVADTSPEGVARGKYLMEAVISCDKACHSEGSAPFAGYVEEVNEGPISAVFAVPNLTPDDETGLGAWSDAEIARAIREGIDKDGTGLVIMPASGFHRMSDADIAAVVGYLRSLEPVHNEIPPIQVNLVGKIMMGLGMFGPGSVGEPITAPQEAPPAGSLEYGEYLVSLGDCRGCHGAQLNGGSSGFVGYSPNLTPGGALADWSEADFVTLMQTGVTPDGRRLSEGMPWQAYSDITEEDLKAMFQYLKSLPALEIGK